jgi:predicted oxidoreductase
MSQSPEQLQPIRRGPYGPARAFVPKGQDITWIDSKDTLLAALERLRVLGNQLSEIERSVRESRSTRGAGDANGERHGNPLARSRD